jgi:hypothetical protein
MLCRVKVGVARRLSVDSSLFNPYEMLIEDKVSGIALIQGLKRESIFYVAPCKRESESDKYMRLTVQ